jgi:type IV secretory pathway VirB4 component
LFKLGLLKKKKVQEDSSALRVSETSEEREELPLSYPSLVDNMLNDGVHFEADYFILKTGLGKQKYARSFFVKPSGYPRSVRIGWLDALFSGDDMDCSVHIEPLDRNTAIKKLQNKIEELSSVMYSAKIRHDQATYDDAFQKREDTKALQRQIKNNTNGLYYVSVQATVYADSLEELNEKCVMVENEVAGESIEILSAYDRQKEGFLSCLPLGKNYLPKSDRNLDQYSLTAIFPHASSKLNHVGGFPIGRFDRDYVYFNNFDESLNNYSVGIFGVSGSGKSVLVKQIIGRGFMDGIMKNVIIDVEPEYIGLTYALGGVVIPIYPSKAENVSRINPLDIFPEKEIINRGTEDEYIEERINLNEKIKEALEFFKVMKESLTPDGRGLTPVEIGVLNDILENLYKSRGITENPDSIYEQIEHIDDSGSITYRKQLIEMPTITDVYRELCKEAENGYGDELRELCNVVKLFTRDKAFGMFDGQTRIISESNVSLDEAPVVTFDISKLSSNGIERPLAQHVLMNWVWNRFVVSNPKVKKRVIIDEAWMMIKYSSMMEWLKILSARGRKWNVSLTLVSQRYEMFDRTEVARDVVSQFDTVCFLRQSDQDIEPILKTFRLSEDVGNLIRTAATGQVLMKAGKQIVTFQSEPTDDEWVYLNTNQNIDMAKTKKKEISREEMIAWLEDMSHIPEGVVA